MKKTFTLALFMICCTTGFAQEAALDTLLKRFTHYRENALQEKIYAHVDRTFYLTGETLWFKIYVVDGSFHRPIDVSRVAYAELLDKANFPVLQVKIELKEGNGSGSFFLPASLSSGNYRLRIYTNWMKNSHPGFYFNDVISVVNPFVIPDTPARKSEQNCSVDFFPEGGNLVAGIQSRIGFRVFDGNGKGLQRRGYIVDGRGDTVTSFVPAMFGLGNFMFTPLEGQEYRAVLPDQDDKKLVHDFPLVHPSGYVMQVLDTADYLRIRVASKGMQDRHVYLFAHARNITAHAERKAIQDNSALFMLKKSTLPEGIIHLTVFNEQLKPLCERLYFTHPDKALKIDISTNAKVYNFRKKVSLTLRTTGKNGEPLPANLSLSVFKVDSLTLGTTPGIYPYLWLRSDLTGAIESPEYYFDRHSRAPKEAIDNLMLTHGWRRFEWQDVLTGHRQYVHLPEVNGHIINGVVTRDGEPKQSVFTYLGSPGKITRAYGSWSNRNGEVRFEIKDFYGSRRIILQTKTDSTETHEVKIQNPFSASMDDQIVPELVLDEDLEQDLLERSISMQVQDIYYNEETRNLFSRPMVDSTAFFGQADNTYLLDDFTRFPVMEEVMREYVPPVFVRKRRDGFHFLVIDHVNGGILPGDPMVLVDGIPVFDVDDVMKMDPLLVRKLEVVKRQYYLGQAVFFGIISYSTYNGDLGDLQLDPRSVSMDYDGLQLQRRFFTPQYSGKEGTPDRMPDQRHLLHWQDDITTDAEGKHRVEFFTSDVPGSYRVVVEGLSHDGSAGTETHTFSVKAADNP